MVNKLTKTYERILDKSMKKVLFVTNIPSPYRVDFYNQLGKFVDLTVIFEATGAQDIRFDYREYF